jgi:ribose transport system permease protein
MNSLATILPSQENLEQGAARASWGNALLKNRATLVFGADLLLVLLFTILSQDHVFWSVANAQALLLNATEGLLLAVALSLLLGAGIFDLSVGANLVLSSVVGATVLKAVTQHGNQTHYVALGTLIALCACVATGAIYGFVNGLIIARLRVNSLIATLGTMGIGTGIALLITNGSDIYNLPAQIQTDFGLKTFVGIPIPAIGALALTALIWAAVRYTRLGTRIQAIGSSALAARRAGLHVPHYQILLLALAGALAGLAGFVDIAHYGSTTIAGHTDDALAAVTSAVIGGTALTGGRISISGALSGTALSQILLTGLVIIGVASFYQLIVIGCVLILAVALDRVSEREPE